LGGDAYFLKPNDLNGYFKLGELVRRMLEDASSSKASSPLH